MSDHLARRVDPRALLACSTTRKTVHITTTQAQRPQRRLANLGLVSLAACVGLSAFGTMVVRANDDNGMLSFIRQQSRPAPVRTQQPTYFAPRSFFPTSQPVQRTVAIPQPNRAPLVAAYAPFSGFFSTPTAPLLESEPRRKAKVYRSEPRTRVTLAAPSRSWLSQSGQRGGVAYCVRTCDGFYFPIGVGSGDDRTDAATCNSFCPTAETRVYLGPIGSDIDEARAQESGKAYTALPAAFTYRKSVDKSCSCSANGMGVGTTVKIERDGLLRPGDIVMTKIGMRIFNGGTAPYRAAHFTAMQQSERITTATREQLIALERASLPGRSGLAPLAQQANRSKRDELKDLKTATRSVEASTKIVRYVGPDRQGLSR